MLHAIQNEFLTVTAIEMGAELQSVRSSDGTEYLWQGDATYWGGHAPNLFPYVARLWQGAYRMDGEEYHLPIHGFAPTSRFELVQKSDICMVFELCDSENTLEQYPRRFAFRLIYELKENELGVTYEVQNYDEKTMYFGLGGHPGFNVPLEEGVRFEDYRLRFAEKCAPMRVSFSADCFVEGEDTKFTLEEGTMLPLRHEMFDDDAIVLRDMAREVVLEAPGSAKKVLVSYPDMPYLGIWHRPKSDAPYVCIEPWMSLPAQRGEITAFEKQADLIRLESGKTYTNRWTIAIDK